MNRLILVLLALFITAIAIPVHAQAKHTEYPVSLLAGSGGKILPERIKLHEGRKNVKFQIKPNHGFVISNVILNGASLGRTPVVTIPVVTGPVSIEATFASGVPTVDAGNDATTFVGIPVTLNPTVTPALPGDSLRYDWQIIKKPVISRAGFVNSHAATPTFVALRPGDYTIQLRVTEGKYRATDTVVVRVLPSPESNPPVAVPTAPATAFVGRQVTLSGIGSYDPSGLPLSYNWQILSRPQGSTATLTNATSATSTITPDLAGTYKVTLTVSNRYAVGKPQAVSITVRQNAVPLADAGPDQAVPEGTAVLLDGSASRDTDGDPLTFSWAFQSCPQGTCPTLSDAAVVKPSFVAVLPGTYILTLTVGDGSSLTSSDTVMVTAAAVSNEDPSLLKLQWQYGVFGTNIGQTGLHVTDFDGDGSPEIIAGSSVEIFGPNALWYILRRNVSGSYDQVWRSEPYASRIVRLLVADLTCDGKTDVVIGLDDGTIKVFDGATRTESKLLTAAGNLADMAVADVDGDGKPELVTTDGTGVSVYTFEGGAMKWSLPTGGGSSLAVGNVDNDSSLEIVTTSYDGNGYVIDAVSRVLEWEYINSFGVRVALGDIDNDGRQEIIGAASWGKITMFDAERKTPAWDIPTSHDVSALLVVDVTGDGKPEIVYGDAQWGGIHAINTATQSEIWSINNPDIGVQGLAFGDPDQDGKMEILWGGGGASSGADHLYIADRQTGSIEWQSMHIDGPLSALDIGDVDGDGDDEIVMVSRESDSGYEEGVIHIFDAKTHALEYREKLGLMDWMGVRSVRIGDFDGDGNNEFVVTTANIYDGLLRVYNGATRAVKYQSIEYNGNFFTALAIADVDNDGKKEIIAGQGREHSGAQGTYLMVFDGATLNEKWRSVDLGAYWEYVRDIKIADIDGDGHQEIIAAFGGQLVVYDGITHTLKYIGNRSAVALAVAGNGREILVGREDGAIDLLDGTTFAVKKTVPTSGNSEINALKLVDLTGDGAPEWLVAYGGILEVLDGKQQEFIWKSPVLAQNLGLFNHLVVRDSDGDGRSEVLLGDSVGIYHFEQKP